MIAAAANRLMTSIAGSEGAIASECVRFFAIKKVTLIGITLIF